MSLSTSSKNRRTLAFLLAALMASPAFATGYTVLKPIRPSAQSAETGVQTSAIGATDPLKIEQTPRSIGHAPQAKTLPQALSFMLTGKPDADYKTSKSIWQSLQSFYEERHFQPIWMGETGFSPRSQALRGRIADARFDALNPADYALPDLFQARIGFNEAAKAELKMSLAAIDFASDLAAGTIRPGSISGYITYNPKRPSAASVLSNLVETEDVAAALDRYQPQYVQYKRLKAMLRDSLTAQNEAAQAPILPAGVTLKRGMTHPGVQILRKRLSVAATAQPNFFDAELDAALRAFQKSNKLGPDGVLGPRTRKILNGGRIAPASPALIAVNMERLRWLPRQTAKHRVLVNIPEYRVRIYTNEREVYNGRVVVGKIKHQTPQFNDQIEHIVVNPYWNVPQSIATKEMLPKLLSNPSYLASSGYQLLSNGKQIDSTAVNWASYAGANALPFRIRQPPGNKNALGNVKFMFPNKHAVYLHDTQSKSLFQRNTRAFSHGCVRVHQPFKFADALLALEKDWSGNRLKSLVGSGSPRTLRLNSKIPINIGYFTLRAHEDGSYSRFSDVYGYDNRIAKRLGFLNV